MTRLLARLCGQLPDDPSEAEISGYLASLHAPAPAGAHPYDQPKGTRQGELTATESSRP